MVKYVIVSTWRTLYKPTKEGKRWHFILITCALLAQWGSLANSWGGKALSLEYDSICCKQRTGKESDPDPELGDPQNVLWGDSGEQATLPPPLLQGRYCAPSLEWKAEPKSFSLEGKGTHIHKRRIVIPKISKASVAAEGEEITAWLRIEF